MQRPDISGDSPPKRPRQAGTLPQVRMSLWWALRHAEHVMSTTRDESVRLRAVHAITQASMAYCKLHETLDLQARIERLEALAERNGHGR